MSGLAIVFPERWRDGVPLVFASELAVPLDEDLVPPGADGLYGGVGSWDGWSQPGDR
jgi:hypothetical protein